MLQRLTAWFTAGFEQTLQVSKSVSLIATIVGAYYFVSYLGKLGIPFPSDFSVLPSILLAIGVVTVGITAIVFVYFLLAGWIQTDPLNMGYAELIHMRPSGLVGHGGRAAIATICAIYVVPYLAWVAILVSTPEEKFEVYLGYLFTAFAVWACLIALAKIRERKEGGGRKKTAILFGKISASIFLLSFFTVISSFVYIIFLQSRGLMESWGQTALSLVTFAAINLGVLYPLVDSKAFDKANQEALSGQKLDGAALSKRIYRAPVLLAVGILVLISLFPPFSAYVGELPTKILGLSSNEPRLIYTDKKTANVWPAELRAECDAYSCKSVPVVVVLDLGKYLYIRPMVGEHLYRLERINTIERFGVQDREANVDTPVQAGEAQQGAAADAAKPRD